MEDLPEAGNLLHGRRRGDRHREGRRCREDHLQVLDTGLQRLDTAHQPRTGSGTMDAANAMGTSSRGPADAMGNVVDAVRSSGMRVRSGMICIFSNYRLRIKKNCKL
jgi:hypothetical protein